MIPHKSVNFPEKEASTGIFMSFRADIDIGSREKMFFSVIECICE